MEWIRTTERLPTKADVDWDGAVCVCSSENMIITKMRLQDAIRYISHAAFSDRIWWLEGYRTERPDKIRSVGLERKRI